MTNVPLYTELPITAKWREILTTLKENGRTVTVYTGSREFADAEILTIEEHVIILATRLRVNGSTGSTPAQTHIVALDYITGITRDGITRPEPEPGAEAE